MRIGKALLENWKREKLRDTEGSRVVDLERYMKYQYDKRYVALCRRAGITPVSLSEWLLRDTDTI